MCVCVCVWGGGGGEGFGGWGPVLVGITHRKPEFLEMRRTYAQ